MEELSKYLEMLTTSGGKELDQELLKKVKNICKVSEENVKYAFHVIMVQLNKEHSEIRYSALLVINELFKRSHVFRNLLLSEFQDFLELTAETNQEFILPPPKAAAKSLQIKTLELVQEWNNKFGEDYKRLKLGYNFLRDYKKVDFANLHARTVIAQRRDQTIQQRQAKVIQDNVNKVSLEMSEKTAEIKNVLNQMENCFCLLLPFYDDMCTEIDLNMPSTSKQVNHTRPVIATSKGNKTINLLSHTEEHKTAKETREDMLRHHGLHGSVDNFNIQVTINPPIQTNDNTADIICNLKDLYTQVEKSMLPSVEKWIQVLTKGSNCTGFLKKAIDLKNLLIAAKQKFKDLKILPQSSREMESSDDEDFETVEEKEGYEPIIPSHLRKEYGLEPLPANKKSVSAFSEEIVKDPTSYESNIHAYYEKLAKTTTNLDSKAHVQSCSKMSTLDTEKAKMLAEAPHLPYDIDLYHWEDKKIEAPSIVRFDSLHKFWQPYENETTEIQDKDSVASLRMRKIDFSGKFVPVKWKCRAPLPSGKLCPRQDRYKCPFHGKIIPRDETGKPLNAVDSNNKKEVISSCAESEVPEWQNPEFLKDLEASTGINFEIPKKRTKKDPKKPAKKENKISKSHRYWQSTKYSSEKTGEETI